MHITLIVPVSPHHVGTGLAHRVANWVSFCERVGTVRTIVVPVAGRSMTGDEVLTPGPDSDATLPRLARGLTRAHGRANAHLAQESNLIVAVRAYLGDLALGMKDVTGVPVLIDLDDDDATYFESAGDTEESARFRALVARLRDESVALVSADGFDGTVRIPNSVGFPDADRGRRTTTNSAIMVANFTYEPNAEGAKWLQSEVTPLVISTLNDFSLTLVGPGGQRLDPDAPGLVGNLADAYSQASVALAPILRGSGTRTKIIEAWAHRVPVVSTSIGASGLDATDGSNILIGDTPAEFARHIVSVLTDAAFAEELADDGWRHGRDHFATDVVAALAESTLRSAADPRRWVFDANPNAEISETPDGLVVFDPVTDIVHDLNRTAAMVFMLADGTRDRGGIADEVASLFGMDAAPVDEVNAVIDQLVRQRLLRATITPTAGN